MAVMIGIDPHKRSHTAVAINGTDEVLGQLRVAADRRQIDRLLAFAASWPERMWAVENVNGLGRLLSRQLLDAGENFVDVPAKLSARVRVLSGSGHKTDAHGAHSTAIAGCHGTGVKQMTADDPLLVVLDLVLERRWQLVAARQAMLCRIHDHLACLLPGGAHKHLTADKTAGVLRRVRPRPTRSGSTALRRPAGLGAGGCRKRTLHVVPASIVTYDERRSVILVVISSVDVSPDAPTWLHALVTAVIGALVGGSGFD